MLPPGELNTRELFNVYLAGTRESRVQPDAAVLVFQIALDIGGDSAPASVASRRSSAQLSLSCEVLEKIFGFLQVDVRYPVASAIGRRSSSLGSILASNSRPGGRQQVPVSGRIDNNFPQYRLAA